jgi:hypothetical protein
VNKYISLIKQAGMLKSYFPKSKITRNGEKEITWTHTLVPTPLSDTYKVKIHYKKGDVIKVYITDPLPLPLAKNAKVLPHVYSTPKQQLCLYYPRDREWSPSMYYTETIIPWISEWLLHYEIWIATGTWQGGGIEHDMEKEEDE